MYLEWFNLQRKPFELVPNPDFFFQSRSHRKAVTYLTYGVRERAGFILLTGEVGSGKTTLVRGIIRNFEKRTIHAMIFNTKVTPDQLLVMVADDFGLEIKGKSKVELLRDLNTFLIERYAEGCQPILIIDEAQNLTAEHLEEVRLLSNLETEQVKLLQIILVGQPELRDTLASANLRQLRQRISISCHLQPLTRTEMEKYILHRLEVAGNREAIGIPREVYDAIFKFSRGIPRLVNIMCDFLLVSAFADEVREITPALITEVLGDMDAEHSYWGNSPADPEELADLADEPPSLEQEDQPGTEPSLFPGGDGNDAEALLEESYEAGDDPELQLLRQLDQSFQPEVEPLPVGVACKTIQPVMSPPPTVMKNQGPPVVRPRLGFFQRIFGRC